MEKQHTRKKKSTKIYLCVEHLICLWKCPPFMNTHHIKMYRHISLYLFMYKSETFETAICFKSSLSTIMWYNVRLKSANEYTKLYSYIELYLFIYVVNNDECITLFCSIMDVQFILFIFIKLHKYFSFYTNNILAIYEKCMYSLKKTKRKCIIKIYYCMMSMKIL